MSRCKLVGAVSVGLVAFLVWHFLGSYLRVPDFPSPNENSWWGPGNSREQNRNVVPFKIDVADEDLTDLKDRLRRFLEKPHKPPLENQGFQYGFNSNYLKQVITYWRNEYDWKKRQAYLNQYPQFKTIISGLDVHFVRVTPRKGTKNKVLPLLLLHGWPSSVREYYDVIPHLTTPRETADFVFELIIPSLPGYGFSSPASKPGFGPHEMAVLMKNLMERLKFDKFYVAGGDWGSLIGAVMSQYYPERVLGFYSTMCMVNTPMSNLKWALGSLYPPLIVEDRYRHKMYPATNIILTLVKEMGYFWIQATKPDTIGTALSDTPAGLAAYILEKYSTWTNKAWMNRPDGGLTEKYSLDSLLDNVMIYWISGSIMTSQRLYSEAFGPTGFALQRHPVKVPTVCARYHHDAIWQSESILRDQYTNLIHVTDHEDVGHFAALEDPKTYSEDVWTAVKAFESHRRKSNVDKNP